MSVKKEQFSAYVWSDSYLLDIHRMDAQHKGLFITLGKLQKYILGQGDAAQINKLFSDLERQTKVHFLTEELLMQENNYPDYESHKNTHDLLISQLENMIAAHQAPTYKNFRPHWIEKLEIVDFLSAWVFAHVTHEDKALGNYLKSKGLK